ncbi:probable inactive tRNA-specific adenosine deaminase-like protein 3 [Sergentomyia squamirostris]
MEEPQLKRMKFNWTISSVLDAVYSRGPELVDAIVATVNDKRSLAMFMREITRLLPIPEFGHLKRIHGTNVLLTRANDVEQLDNVVGYLRQKGLSEALVEQVKQIRREMVPREAPILRWQYEIASQYWPCKFHPDKYLETLYNNDMFSCEQTKFHIAVMEMCLKLSDKNRNPSIMVDPRDGAVVTVAWSQLHRHPLHHSAMVAVDNVARSQSGGVWNTDDVTETLNSVRDSLKSVQCSGGDCGNLDKYGPYLCTGYDLYIVAEPCLMCSMALIHSRTRRIFFHRMSPETGALVSRVQLHTVKELNHHYQVFRIH